MNRLRKWLLDLSGHVCDVEAVEIPCSHEGASVDKEKIRAIQWMDENEQKEHAAEISKIYRNKSFNNEIESLIDQQVYWMAEKALDEIQLAFGRGSINGMRLVQERFGLLDGQHSERTKPREQYNPYDIIPKS